MDSNRSILIAEDNPEIANHWGTTLTRGGWIVTIARDGREALGFLDAADFSVVVCDLHLGPGPTAIDILRKWPNRWRGTPFIVITGMGTIAACREALMLGARDFIEKPVSTEMFLFLLENVMRAQGIGSAASSEVMMFDDDEYSTAGRVRTALMYLDRVLFHQDTSVARVAEAAGVSAEHLARLFRRHVGRTPLEVINTLRIRQAEKMLPNPRLTVNDVGKEVGYKSQQQFTNWFRWKHGITPSEWRAKLMGNESESEPDQT